MPRTAFTASSARRRLCADGLIGVGTSRRTHPWPGAGRCRPARLHGHAGARPSESPNAWALFGYLAIVLVANTVIARMRDWRFLAAAGFVGAGLWCLLYLSDAAAVDLTVVMFTNAVTLGALAFAWLGRWADGETASGAVDWPSIAPAFFVALAATVLFVDPDFQAVGGAVYGGVLILAMLLVALYRPQGLPLLHAAGVATVLVHAQGSAHRIFRRRVFRW